MIYEARCSLSNNCFQNLGLLPLQRLELRKQSNEAGQTQMDNQFNVETVPTLGGYFHCV